MDVMTAGRMAVFADPGGAAFAVWQAGDSIGAELVNEPVSLSWNELLTRDTAQAEAFYKAVFGWGSTTGDQPGGPPYTQWDRDGTAIGGMMFMVPEMFPAEVPSHWMVYFAVADTDATCARCTELGGSVHVPPTDIPPGRFSLLQDPQGAMFQVIALNPDYAG
jgi:predicted enzyme related to lactoylglutathione lyase